MEGLIIPHDATIIQLMGYLTVDTVPKAIKGLTGNHTGCRDQTEELMALGIKTPSIIANEISSPLYNGLAGIDFEYYDF